MLFFISLDSLNTVFAFSLIGMGKQFFASIWNISGYGIILWISAYVFMFKFKL